MPCVPGKTTSSRSLCRSLSQTPCHLQGLRQAALETGSDLVESDKTVDGRTLDRRNRRFCLLCGPHRITPMIERLRQHRQLGPRPDVTDVELAASRNAYGPPPSAGPNVAQSLDIMGRGKPGLTGLLLARQQRNPLPHRVRFARTPFGSAHRKPPWPAPRGPACIDIAR